jgi:hypothetical protein
MSKSKTTVDIVDLLAAILANTPALPGAPCFGQPELFDGTESCPWLRQHAGGVR